MICQWQMIFKSHRKVRDVVMIHQSVCIPYAFCCTVEWLMLNILHTHHVYTLLQSFLATPASPVYSLILSIYMTQSSLCTSNLTFISSMSFLLIFWYYYSTHTLNVISLKNTVSPHFCRSYSHQLPHPISPSQKIHGYCLLSFFFSIQIGGHGLVQRWTYCAKTITT